MKAMKRTIALVLVLLTVCCVGVTAFAVNSDNGQYSITWVYEDRNVVDWYDEGETIVEREAILSDGSVGGWSTDKDAEKAPMLSPVPETMPAQDLTFYAKKSYASEIGELIEDQLREKFLSKEFWKSQYPLLWVFPYIWMHIRYFFSDLFA